MIHEHTWKKIASTKLKKKRLENSVYNIFNVVTTFCTTLYNIKLNVCASVEMLMEQKTKEEKKESNRNTYMHFTSFFYFMLCSHSKIRTHIRASNRKEILFWRSQCVYIIIQCCTECCEMNSEHLWQKWIQQKYHMSFYQVSYSRIFLSFTLKRILKRWKECEVQLI